MKKALVLLAVLLFCSATAQNARAQSDLGLKRVGVDVGIVSPEDLDATFGLGMSADLGTMAPNVGLSAHLGYWGKSEDVFGGGDVSFRDVTLGMRCRYFFPTSSTSIHPYAGGGLGMHMLHMEMEIPDGMGGTYSADDSETKLGIDLGGGFNMPMSTATDFTADVWYSVVDNFSQLSMKVGMSWKLK